MIAYASKDNADEYMEVFVRLPSHGKTITFAAQPLYLAINLKALTRYMLKIPTCPQRLIFEDRELEDGTATLQDLRGVEGAIWKTPLLKEKDLSLRFKLYDLVLMYKF